MFIFVTSEIRAMLQYIPGISLWNRNEGCAPCGMAKMKYTEIPRDFSSDSIPPVRIMREGLDERKKTEVDPLTEEEEEVSEKLPGRKDSEGPQEEEEEHLLKEPHDKHLRLPSPRPHRKLSQVTCYDNPGWTGGLVVNGTATGGTHKSSSLPSDASSLRSMEAVVLEALRVSPEDLASQITLLDVQVFKEIHPEELASCAWNKKNKLTVAPNVVAFTQRFNHISFWTVQEVLSGSTPKHRAEILSHYIRVGKKLYEYNNFHSLFAVISALQSASVYRLSKTWGCLTKKEKQAFDKLAEVFSDKNNWQNLREHMESLKLPCIPYLGVFLTDLTYIDMAHPARSAPEQRTAKMNNVLRIVSSLQESDYTHLPILPHIQRYLRSIRYIEELQKFVEDDQYKLSLKLEPPSPGSSLCGGSKESVDSGAVTQAASPAKHRFTHRKCQSLGNNVLTTTNCDKSARNRHLLDDSVIEEGTLQSNTRALQMLNLSPLKRIPAKAVMNDVDLVCEVSMEGCLRRKTLLKEGRKPHMTPWTRYWVQLWANCLVFYLPKAFKGAVRSDYRREPCKVSPMAGCLVSLSDNPTHPGVFHLRDPIKSNLYRFKAGSREEAIQWISALQDTLGLALDTNPTNLISFE